MEAKKPAEQEIPKSLMAAYVAANGRRQYTGSIDEFISIRYLLFRTSYRGDREPPSKRAWLQHMLDYEKQALADSKRQHEED